MHIVQGDFPFHVYVLSEQHEVFQDTFLQTLKKSPVCQSFNEPCVPVLVEQYFPWDENSQNGNPQKACIVFNTEQLSRPSILERAVFQIQLEQVTQWWDQSLANIDIVKNRVSPLHALKLRHVPIVCDPEKVFILKEEQDSQDKIYDLGVIHTQTPWRNEFVDNLRKKGLCVKVISSFDWNSKAKDFGECKALLNVHADSSFQVFESARCNPFLDAGIPVLTEKSLDSDPRCQSEFTVHNAISKIRLFLAHFKTVDCHPKYLGQSG